jgi:hypothetical protein
MILKFPPENRNTQRRNNRPKRTGGSKQEKTKETWINRPNMNPQLEKEKTKKAGHYNTVELEHKLTQGNNA